MNKLQLHLGPVETTMLGPLFARAKETSRSTGVLYDPTAREVVEAVDYDFRKWRDSDAMLLSALRSRMFDEEVGEFLKFHPTGTVIELGCGMTCRFNRLDNGQADWLDVDLPDVIALRRQFIAESTRHRTMASDIQSFEWIRKALTYAGPYCFVAEASFAYLRKSEVMRVLRTLERTFPGAWLILDTTPSETLPPIPQGMDARPIPPPGAIRWVCDEPIRLQATGISLVHTRSLAEAPPHVLKRLPWLWRLMFRLKAGRIARFARMMPVHRFVL
jgi:O-methyltransferase involved in polyketide biosynthesis